MVNKLEVAVTLSTVAVQAEGQPETVTSTGFGIDQETCGIGPIISPTPLGIAGPIPIPQ